MLTIIARLLKVLNSETAPSQIAAAVILALFMGLSPLAAPHNLFLLLLVLVLRVNLSLFLISFALFSGIAWLLDPLTHWLGLLLLQAGALEGLWSTMYNTGFWRFMAFNNTLVLGSIVMATIIAIPLFPVVTFLVRNYREQLRERILRSRIMLILKGNKWGNKLYSAYTALNR